MKLTVCATILLTLLCTSGYNPTEAAITIETYNFGYVLGPKGEPIMAAEITATQNNDTLELTINNITLLQSKSTTVKNLTVEPPQPNGRQTITWSMELWRPHNVTFELIATSNNEVGTTELGTLPQFNGYNAAMYSVDLAGKREIIHRADFTQENQQYVYLYISGDYSQIEDISSRPWVDSVTFTNPNISHDWWPYPPAAGWPPQRLLYNNLYRIELNYNQPPGNPYMRSWMIIHFGGGIKYRFELTAHEPAIESQPLLTLLNPIGGEHFAPCEELLIQWRGHNPNYPTHIQFNTNGQDSTTWQTIRYIPGDSSEYLWKIPTGISADNCYIRISQGDIAPRRELMYYDEGKIMSAVFNEIGNPIANKILTASNLNNIIEYEITNRFNKKTIINLPDSILLTNAIYTTNDRIVALDSRNKQLLFYNSGDNTLQKSVTLTNMPENYKPMSITCDSGRRFILIRPEIEYGNTLLFFDTAGSYITSLSDSLPFTDVYLSDIDNQLYYSLIDNTIKSISLADFPNFNNTKQFDFAKEYNTINKIAVSPDGSMILAATRRPPPKNHVTTLLTLVDNIIYDTRREQIYKNLQVNTTTAFNVSFSPSSTISIVACPAVQQIVMTDLTTNRDIVWGTSPISGLRGITVSKTGNAIIAYAEGLYNTVYMAFAMPETASHTTPFAIVKPSITINNSQTTMPPLLLGTTDTVTIEQQLCNNGLSAIELTAARFSDNEHIELSPVTRALLPITLAPGDCLTLQIFVHPKDTGTFTRSLHLTDTCQGTYEFPFAITGIDRQLTFLNDTINTGEVCVNSSNTIRLELFRNDDSIAVIINNVITDNVEFAVTGFTPGAVLQPGEVFTADVTFAPKDRYGERLCQIVVQYANQYRVVKRTRAKGLAVGTEYTISHTVLTFLPEEPTRTFTLTNNSNVAVSVDSVTIAPAGTYVVITNFPQTLAPDDSINIEVQWRNINDKQPSTLTLHSGMCTPTETVQLQPYSGTAHLWIPQLTADVHDVDFTIPIHFTKTERVPYKGERFFDASVTLNATLFYPTYATSSYGEVEIYGNRVIAGMRRIDFRLRGNFSGNNDLLLELHGTVSLGDAPTTAVAWSTSSVYFGSTVAITADAGSLSLTGLCDDRLVSTDSYTNLSLSPQPALRAASVYPNPVVDIVTFDYEIIGDDSGSEAVTIELYDMAGGLVWRLMGSGSVGKHSVPIDMSELAAGAYILSIRHRGKQQIIMNKE